MQGADNAVQRCPQLLRPLQRARASDRLDAAGAGRHAAFRDHGEQADVAGRADVCPAAQLHAEAGYRDDPYGIAVLLAEQRHRTRLDCLGGGPHFGLHGRVRHDLRVDDRFDPVELLGGHRLEVHEVEPQAVRRDQ